MKNYLGDDWSEEDSEGFEMYEFMNEKLKDSNLHIYGSSEYTGYYVGRSWGSVGDDETGKQFKQSVEDSAKKIFGNVEGFTTVKEAWRDG